MKSLRISSIDSTLLKLGFLQNNKKSNLCFINIIPLAHSYAISLASTVFPIPGAPSISMRFGYLLSLSGSNILPLFLMTLESVAAKLST